MNANWPARNNSAWPPDANKHMAHPYPIVWPSRSAALWALLLTFALFVGLPLVDYLCFRHEPEKPGYELRTVDTALPPPPPPPPPEAPVDRPPEPPPPRPVEPRRLMAVQPTLKLDLALGELSGDFAIDFAMARPDLMDRSAYVFEISELDRVPQPLVRMPPIYPDRARMRGIEGYVEVEFVVDATGAVTGASVTRAEPAGIFEVAALQAVRRWKFEPGRKNGVPVNVRVRQRLQFTLQE